MFMCVCVCVCVCVFFSAPVSGGPGGAMAGTLSVMIGGEAEHVQKADVLIKCFSSNIVHFGPIGKYTNYNFNVINCYEKSIVRFNVCL